MNANMITIHIDDILKQRERGQDTLYWLAKESGVPYITLWKLNRAENPKSMSFSVLDRVCDVLQCEPGDILKRVVR